MDDPVVREHLLHLGSDPMSFPPIAKGILDSVWIFPPFSQEEAIEQYEGGIFGSSLIAGWELLPDGQRRELTFPHAYSLHQEVRSSSPFKLMHWYDLDGLCSLCHQPLQCFLDIDLSSPQLSWIPLPGSRWILPACVHCLAESFYGYWNAIWKARSPTDAQWEFIPTNNFPQDTDRPFDSSEEDCTLIRKQHAFSLGNQRQTIYEEVGPLLYPLEAVLGGFPDWAQGAQYISCPQCQHPMPFLIQIPFLLADSCDCMSYLHLCTDCSIVQLNSQFD